jgi:hypothetical protein
VQFVLFFFLLFLAQADYNAGYYKCTGKYDSTSQTCIAVTDTDKLSTINARCDLTATPKQTCPLGSSCINKVCRPLAAVGSFCKINYNRLGASNNDCITNLCDLRKCRLPYSIGDVKFFLKKLELCENAGSCYSGVCTAGVCVASTKNPCYTNDDCQQKVLQSSETCYLGTGTTNSDTVGTCYSTLFDTRYDLQNCMYNKCSSIFGTNQADCINKNCTTEYIKDVCAQKCPLHKENRNDPSFGQFLYDCKSYTRTAWASDAKCEIKQDKQITNCNL